MSVKLTETAIAKATREAAAAGARIDLADAGCPGLRMRVTSSGARAWALVCRDRHGRMRRFPLGAFPGMGISEARVEARRVRAAVKDGADPTADRRRDRAIGQDAKAGLGTLAAVLDIYGAHKGAELKSWPDGRKRIEIVFKPLLAKPVAAMTAADLQMAADAYPHRQSAAFAVRTIRPALKWAAGRRHVPACLPALLSPATTKPRTRILSRDELAKLLPALRADGTAAADLLRLLLLTLTRRSEAAGARWRDVDLTARTWLIPITKNGEPHTVPLSRQAAALLAARRQENARPDTLVFASRAGRALANWDKRSKRLQAISGTTGWTRHDLRRTGATMLGEMGETPDIIEAALNHVSIRSALAATYNRSRYRPQVAAALQRLADALDGIEQGAATVIPMRRDVAGV